MKISVQSLKPGLSQVNEIINPDFIDQKYIQYYPNMFNIVVYIDKIDKDLRLKLKIKTKANYICDRCLVNYPELKEMDFEQIVKIGITEEEMDPEIIYLSADAIEYDIDTLINEAVILNHPLKMLCKEKCAGICPGCGADLNKEKCACGKTDFDPRWEELRKLIK